jgi:ATP/maltotriose-dependent transcriptional regulator MalT/two-component SAPR family response regulator
LLIPWGKYGVSKADSTGKHPPLAKITRPVFTGIFPRKRLFQHIKKCRDRPITYITAPPGSGKTTLVASYLDFIKAPCLWYQVDKTDDELSTFFYYMGLAAKKAAPRQRKSLPLLAPEYLLGIPTFTHRYFEELYNRLKPSSIIVFDNYQQVTGESKFQEVINEGLSIIPEKIHVIVISREGLPQALVRLHANNNIHFLGWDEIRFTLNEAEEILRIKGLGGLTSEELLWIYKKTEGWAAGIVLMAEMIRIQNVDYKLLSKLVPEEIFDYFSSEIFKKTDEETQNFLLKTAFLPQFSPDMAQELTGNTKANCILSDLNHKNYFIQKYVHHRETYQYHPLFREFLLALAKHAYAPEDFLQLQHNTGQILEINEQIEDAGSLFREGSEWDSLIRLIIKHAPSLIAKGRYSLLEEWLSSIPEEMLENTPWLLFWLATCRVPFDPAFAKSCFEKAFEQFRIQNDVTGIFLSWSGIVEAILCGVSCFAPVDKWISVLEELIKDFKTFPSQEIEARVTSSMFSALVKRQPHHPEIGEWEKRALCLEEASEDINFKIQIFCLIALHRSFSGDFQKASLAIDMLRQLTRTRDASPLPLISAKIAESIYYHMTGLYEECLKAANDGLEISRNTGVHVADQILLGNAAGAALPLNDFSTANNLLARMALHLSSSSPHEKAHYYWLKTREALRRGNPEGASAYIELCMNSIMVSGQPFSLCISHLIKAKVMLSLKRYKEAEEQLSIGFEIAYRIRSTILEFLAHMIKALCAFAQGDDASGLMSLRKAFVLGKEKGYYNIVLDTPGASEMLCVKALEAGIEVEYVQEIIRKQKLIPEKTPLHVENWPWHLKIYTLGRFGLVKDNKPLHFSGKIQKKPLEMLKTLIALGGRDVKEEQVSDLLWPLADGDSAHSDFKVTLSRLRRLIGFEDAIKFQDGRLMIDPRYCWVDAWSFERLCGMIDEGFKGLTKMKHKDIVEAEKRSRIEDIMRLSDNAIGMYKGHFLPADAEYSWAISCHERLRSKFLRLIIMSGECLKQAEQWEKAVEHYQRALEVDNLAEEFYRHLLVCYKVLGRKAEAEKLYNRCCKTLSIVLGIEPSSETKAIYKSLISDKREIAEGGSLWSTE